MNYPKPRKYYFDNILLSILLMILSFNANAEDFGATVPMTYDEPLIQDVIYTYQLTSNHKNEYDCIGILNLSISLPSNVATLIFERTLPHILNPDFNNLHFLIKSEYSNTTSNLTIPDIYWGTCFRICTIDTNGNRTYSSIYSINEYIEQNDLNLLLKRSSINSIEDNQVSLYIKNKTLFVETTENVHLSIFGLDGHHIFTGDVYQAMEIPLYNINSPFIIATYKTSHITATKKIYCNE